MSGERRQTPGYEAYTQLEVDREGRVLTVTLAPGTPFNSVTARLHTELASVFATIRNDAETDIVVLRGADSAFCGGADLRWLEAMTSAELDSVFDEGRRIILDMLELPQPIIAAVEGPAVGLGATLALFCDIRVAAANARIGDPHVRIGVVAGDGGAIIWPWLVGAGRAKRFLLTGDLVVAPDAQAMGLVDEIAEPGHARDTAQSMADKLAEGHQAALRGTKASINKLLRDAVNLVLDTSLALEKETMLSEGHRAAVARFLAR